MKTININENYKIEFDGVQFTPFWFKKSEGEKMVAGRMVNPEDKWVTSGKYLNKLETACKWIVDDIMSRGEDVTLAEFVKEYREAVELITEKVGL